MSKKIMVIWGLIVVGLLSTVYILGLRNKDFVYEDLATNLEKATKKYLLDNNKYPKNNESEVVFVNTLLKEKYIKEDNIKEYCIDKIVVQNNLLIDKYIINKDCDKNKE